MKNIPKKCDQCGAPIKWDEVSSSITCEFCGGKTYISSDTSTPQQPKKSKLNLFLGRRRNRFLVAGIPIAFVLISLVSRQVKEKALVEGTKQDLCIDYHKKMGLSTDLSYQECKKKSLIECIKDFKNKFIFFKSIEKREQSYLIDIGTDKSQWQEGQFWRDRGCTVYKQGGFVRRVMNDKNGWPQSYYWFRQGWCKQDSIKFKPMGEQKAQKECESLSLDKLQQFDGFSSN